MITVVVFLKVFHVAFSDSVSVDLTKCKLTHEGTEYVGFVSKTETNLTCQYWHSAKPVESNILSKKFIHPGELICIYIYKQGSELLVDEAFPEGSKVLSKNYCRNPNRNRRGPWCYTTRKELIYDTCDVRLCRISECRISGTGIEYDGVTGKSASGKKCEKWKNKHKLQKFHSEPSFKNRFFPDGSIGQAGSKCRNPDGSVSGPWCYVERDDSDFQAKEICDIPFCDDLGSMMYAAGNVYEEYYFFSSINESQSINISVRLWDPGDWLKGEVYLYLSAYDIASTRKDIERWNSGVEIKISHNGSGILSKEDDELKNTPLILSGAKWTNLEITWVNVDNQSLLIQLFHTPKIKPIGMSEIHIPNSIFEIESFRYIAVGGTPAFWNIPTNDEDCSVHTVTRTNETRFWLIKKTTLGKDLEIFIRAEKAAVITLRTAPMIKTFQVQISFEVSNKIKVFSINNKNESFQITEKPWSNALSFWKWEYFKITLFTDKLQLYWVRQAHTDLILETRHHNIEKVMWVTFGSPKVSYWTIYCDPQGVSEPPPPAPPECVSKESDTFNGTQSITSSGQQCVPWTDRRFLPEKYQNDELFKPYGGRVFCQNFCRNLDSDPKGASCLIKDAKTESGFRQEYCHPRLCSLSDCQLAGTGSDYIGQLNTTRSKRKCRVWAEIKDDVIEEDNFPDPTIKDAANFCRNPSMSVAGSWCFTEDKNVGKDFCYVKDCDKPLECTALIAGYAEGSFIYFLPTWRKHGLHFWLKAWNPDIYEGLIMSMYSLDYSRQYQLQIGAAENEKIMLFYREKNSDLLLIQKTLPHLIPTGKWRGFWLKASLGKIELGYEGVPNSFFEWTSTKKELSFKPMLINFGTMQNHWIGMNFQCDECITTQVSTHDANKIYPINLWREEGTTSDLHLNLRGSGAAFVTLIWTQDFKKKFGLGILSNITDIFLVQYTPNASQTLASFSVGSAMSAYKWSQYTISFTEGTLSVHKDNERMFEWISPFPLLIYWFSVTAEIGTVIWSANCPAADIDGKPRDGSWGKWGPWSCSVTCGKGEGKITRECNDPPPNIFGDECKGLATYEGPCNDFPCGKISPDTINSVRQYLSSQHKSLQVDAGERVVLTCNSQAISSIMAEVSSTNISWTHNGFPYSRTKFHMNENLSLVIPRAQEKHNGIYLCMAYQDPYSIPSKIVLEVISLVVIKPKPNKKVRKGKSLTLKCNGLPLSYVYADLSQRWELNGTVWKDYGLGTLEAFTVDKLENVSDLHAGVWTCVVIQEDFNFKWTTNWIYLKVKSAPSFWSHLMEDVATAPLFGRVGNERNAKILFFAFTGMIVLITVIITSLFIKFLTK